MQYMTYVYFVALLFDTHSEFPDVQDEASMHLYSSNFDSDDNNPSREIRCYTTQNPYFLCKHPERQDILCSHQIDILFLYQMQVIHYIFSNRLPLPKVKASFETNSMDRNQNASEFS